MSEIKSIDEKSPPIPDLPKSGRGDSFLIAETTKMERTRRLAEQEGEKRLAPVKARDHSNEDEKASAPEGKLQNDIPEHPDLLAQRFDGYDRNISCLPSVSNDAKMILDNEQREQEKEKQNRLGLQHQYAPGFNPTPGLHK